MNKVKASEYIEQYGDFEITEELKKCIQHKPKSVWDLKEGDTYFCVDVYNQVCTCEWGDAGFENAQRSIGHITLTEEELEFKIESMKIYEELKRFAKEFADEEWENTSISKYYIYYDYVNDKIAISFDVRFKYFGLYFESEKKAKEAIAAVGEERVKKYYLGVGK